MMKLFTAAQIRAWDKATIERAGITGHQLMEMAANACCEEIIRQQLHSAQFYILCGNGNNGGDGLAIARLLLLQNIKVTVLLPTLGEDGSIDFNTNLRLLSNVSNVNIIQFNQTNALTFSLQPGDILIDALLGTGINRPATGLYAACIEWMNNQVGHIISIDIPSGMHADGKANGDIIVRAQQTFSFETWKLAFLMPENSNFVGDIKILPIGLDVPYYQETETPYQLINQKEAQALLQTRNSFSHKGHFGHALLVAGSYGKIGAAVLAAQACLRSGVGLLTSFIPKCGYSILQSTTLEAMVQTDTNDCFITETNWQLKNYRALGVGPGIGTDLQTRQAFTSLLKHATVPLVIDADALNMLALEPMLFSLLPKGSILTPHLKELERIIGPTSRHEERIIKTQQLATQHEIIIIIKGHFTTIIFPKGETCFNNSGNPGMATGGSGDVLTGILTGLLAQSYKPKEAAILGVYLHGRAGDIAAEKHAQASLLAHDMVDCIGAAYLSLT
jgi:NAD(P)H-hydrate epimerase